MRIKKIWAVYFSPEGNTKRVVEKLADVLADRLQAARGSIDFTLPKNREQAYAFAVGDLVVFGTPVYAGRVPNKILPAVQGLFAGNDALAIPVVTFGNRSYDNALIELRNELEGDGFHTVAGAAFVARHAFSKKLATDRPDADDLRAMETFADRAAQKVEDLLCDVGEASEALYPAPIAVDGIEPIPAYYTPLGMDGKPAKFLKAKPKTRTGCIGCGICVAVCPMGSISQEDPTQVPGLCIKCQACIKNCPIELRYFDDPAFLSHVAMLENTYQRRAENALFV